MLIRLHQVGGPIIGKKRGELFKHRVALLKKQGAKSATKRDWKASKVGTASRLETPYRRAGGHTIRY